MSHRSMMALLITGIISFALLMGLVFNSLRLQREDDDRRQWKCETSGGQWLGFDCQSGSCKMHCAVGAKPIDLK